jgi:hypothetical protein
VGFRRALGSPPGPTGPGPVQLSGLALGSRSALSRVTANPISMNTDNASGDEPPEGSDEQEHEALAYVIAGQGRVGTASDGVGTACRADHATKDMMRSHAHTPLGSRWRR